MKLESASDFAADWSGDRGAVADLQQRWKRETAPPLEDFLQEWSSSDCAVRIGERELVSLVSLDQLERWRRGQRPTAEEYLRRFPQIAADDELALDVIYGEFLLREELGEKPDVRDFQTRFPEFADTLLDQIEFHRAMAANGPSRLSEQDTHRSALSAQLTNAPGTRLLAHLRHFVPGYEILSELGRGGMGIVYRARQLSLSRLVALKMLRAGDCGSASLLARFQAEAEAVARLHHPNIVQIYDYGEHDGMPYLALELVEGASLAAAPSAQVRTPREAAEIVATLARAVQFAHDHGIVHRDLKPANVLTASPMKSNGSGRTIIKITDFGLAKVFREGENSHTQTGTIVGTPSYMAPEQARGNSLLVGPFTDVYALGAILYELLTGQPPFKAATAIETLHKVLTIEAALPTRHVPSVPRDLATIVIKCLQKDPQRRYSSAAELAKDLERYLEDRPIQARPASAAEKGWRWCRRNPVLASLAGSVALLLIVVAAISSFYSWRLSHQLAATSSARQAEGQARNLAEIRLWESYLAEIRAGRGSLRIGQRTESLATVDRANKLLNTIGRTPERVLQLRNATIATLALPDLREERIVATTPGVTRLGLSVAADRYVVYGGGEVTLHRLSDGKLLRRIPQIPQVPLGDPNSIELGITANGRYISITHSRGVRMWRCDGVQSMLVGDWPGATHAGFTPDSKYATVCHPTDGVRILDLVWFHNVKPLLQVEATARPAFHAASRRIAICTRSGVSILDWTTGEVVSELPAETRGALGIDWHPSGEALVVSGLNEGVGLWNVAERRLLTCFPHRGYITRPHFSHDGNYLLTPDDWSRELRLWNTGTGQEVLRSSAIHLFAADSSGSPEDLLVQLRPDGQILWRIVPGLLSHSLLEAQFDSPGDALGIAISPDGRLLAIGRSEGFEVWDLATRRRVCHRGSYDCVPAFEPDGDLLMTCSAGLNRWPLHVSAATGGGLHQTDVRRFGPPEPLSGPLWDHHLSTSRDGSLAVVCAKEGWQLISLDRQRHTVAVQCDRDARGASISPNGAWLALTNWGEDGVSIWDTLNGQHIKDLPAGRFGKPLFSPDGRWLATTPDGVRLWHVADWKPGPEFRAQGMTLGGLAIAFSLDSQVLAISQPEEITRLVDPETGCDWADLLRPDQRNSISIAFTPDHSRLIEVPTLRGSPRVWNLARIREELAQRDLDWPADVLTVRPLPGSGPALWEKTLALQEGDTTSKASGCGTD